MKYSHTLEESSEYLRLTLKYLGQYQLPCDPANYRLWYEYVSGHNKPLSQAINNFVNNEQPITPEICKSLYKRYIVDSNKALLDKVRSRTQNILSEIIRHVVETGGDISRYNDKLDDFAQQIVEDIDNNQSLRGLIGDIISDTRDVGHSTSHLQSRLHTISQEVDTLRGDLEKARQQATTDPLTGIANRRAFDAKLSKETMLARNEDRQLSMLLLDIDHFKAINDNHGHLVGDKVLVATAEHIKDCIKGRDFLARFGGEEFVVILPDTDLAGATIVAEKIRSSFAAINWPQKNINACLNVTISIGVSTYLVGEAWDTFVNRADTALYACKNSGRNRVAC